MAAKNIVPVNDAFIQTVNQVADHIKQQLKDKDASAVRLAHDTDAHQAMQQLQTILEDLLQHVKSMNERTEEVRSCRKDVHFVTNLARNARLYLLAANNTKPGIVDTKRVENLDDIMNCDYLLISDRRGTYQLDQGMTIPDCQIFIKTARNFHVQHIIFSTGGHYVLSDGYSISYCYNLDQTVKVTLN